MAAELGGFVTRVPDTDGKHHGVRRSQSVTGEKRLAMAKYPKSSALVWNFVAGLNGTAVNT